MAGQILASIRQGPGASGQAGYRSADRCPGTNDGVCLRIRGGLTEEKGLQHCGNKLSHFAQ